MILTARNKIKDKKILNISTTKPSDPNVNKGL